MTVNNFRKAASKDELVVLSKTLIKSWKKLLSNGKPQTPCCGMYCIDSKTRLDCIVVYLELVISNKNVTSNIVMSQ